jgi:hypothetical protein
VHEKSSTGETYEISVQRLYDSNGDVFEDTHAKDRMEAGEYEIFYLLFSGCGCGVRRFAICVEHSLRCL